MMETLALDTDKANSFTSIEEQARQLIGPATKNLVLLAWWDNARKIGGPREACADETLACAVAYAAAHDCSHRVRVNGGTLDLFYGSPTGTFEELDPHMVDEVHRQAKTSTFDNVQGG
jgi:hypothetical protein